jgi:hypothetical protein
MGETTQIVEVAKGISDYGALAVMGAAFIIISVITQWSIFRWFKTIVDNMLKNTSCTMDELLIETKTQNEQLADIAEGLRSKTLLEIKDITKTCFDLAIERVCRIIRKVKEENNISDVESTKAKINSLLTNLHEDRNSRFDNHTFHGRPLSSYTSKEWIDWVQEVVEKEVYNKKQNDNRARTNVSTVYDRIKLDLYHRLTNQ